MGSNSSIYEDFQTVVLSLAPLGVLDEELLTRLGQFYAARGLTSWPEHGETLQVASEGRTLIEIVVETLTTPEHLHALCHDLPGYEEGIDDPLELARATAFARIVDEWHQANTEEAQRLAILRDFSTFATIGMPTSDHTEAELRDYKQRTCDLQARARALLPAEDDRGAVRSE